jgi:hypothetical protein
MTRTTYSDDIGTPTVGPTDSGSVLGSGSGLSDPTGTGANGGGLDFSSGAANPYLPISTPTPTAGTSSGSTSSSGSSHTGTTGSTGSRHTTSSSSSSSPTDITKSAPGHSSTVSGSSKTVTTILTPHPVKVRFKATNDPGFPGGLPLHFIATAGITSSERRSHLASSPAVHPHRRF